jgi:hypothetical protein
MLAARKKSVAAMAASRRCLLCDAVFFARIMAVSGLLFINPVLRKLAKV